MRVKIIILLLLLNATPALAQNLVPNSSFECGTDICTAYQLPDILQFSTHACNWSVPTTGTSDIFSTKVNSTDCYTRMPDNVYRDQLSPQFPRIGTRFAGVFTYSKDLSPDTTSYREYLQVKLSKPLKAGEKYCAEMYVAPNTKVRFAANNIGMRFNVNELPYVNNFKPLNLVPQVIEKKIITDKFWTKIGATFEANEPAQYLVIGNFFGDGSTDEQFILNTHYNYAYYYIDDVSVEKLPYDQFTLAGSTVLCEGESTELIASVGVDEVTWTTLKDPLTVINFGEKFAAKPTETTSYVVTAKGCNKIVKDTIEVKVNPIPKVNLGKDTTLCNGQKLILNAGVGSAFRWQDQSVKSTFEVAKPGKYSVEVTNGFICKSNDEIEIKYIDVPQIDLGRDTLVCESFFLLVAGASDYDYEWQDGSSGNTFAPTAHGRFWTRAKNQCGEARDTVTLYSVNDVFIPNVVTPNNDKANDNFLLGINTKGSTDTSITYPVSLVIFNRWGQRVFYDERYNGKWPLNDDRIETGIYYYKASVGGCKDFKGWVQVLR